MNEHDRIAADWKVPVGVVIAMEQLVRIKPDATGAILLSDTGLLEQGLASEFASDVYCRLVQPAQEEWA